MSFYMRCYRSRAMIRARSCSSAASSSMNSHFSLVTFICQGIETGVSASVLVYNLQRVS